MASTRPSMGMPLGQTIAQVVHRATGHCAGRQNSAVFHTQCAFGKLGRHAQQPYTDHPEGGPWPTDGKGCADAGNVTQPNGPRQRGGQRLKMADLPRLLVVGIRIPPTYQVYGQLEPPQLRQTKIHREDDRRSHQPTGDQWKLGTSDRHRIKNQCHEPAEGGGKKTVDGLVDTLRHRGCRQQAASHNNGCMRQHAAAERPVFMDGGDSAMSLHIDMLVPFHVVVTDKPEGRPSYGHA